MLAILESEMNNIIHNLLKIVATIKTVEANCLTTEQKEILHNIEIQLMVLRQQLVESIENDDKI